MRYHTTFKDIAVSLFVVLACTGICLYGMLFFSVINPAQPFADFLVSQLDRGSSLSFRSEGLARSFLKQVELTEVSIQSEEEIPFATDSVVIDQGVGSLVFSLFGKARPITVTLVNPTVSLSVAEMPSLSDSDGSSMPAFLSSWLAKNSLNLRTTSLDFKLEGRDFSTSATDADLFLSLGKALNLSSFKGTIAQAEFQMGQAGLSLSSIRLDMDGNLLVLGEAKQGIARFEDGSVAFEDLAVESELASLHIAKEQLALDFSLSNLFLDHASVQATIPHLASHVVLDSLAFTSMDTSYDLLDLQVGEFTLHTPTASISAKQGEDSMLLGFATKALSPLSLQKQGFAPLYADSLVGSAQREQQGALFAKLSLRQVATVLDDAAFTLSDVTIASQADKDLSVVSATLETLANVAFAPAGITLSSPVVATIALSDHFRALSSSLSLPTLSSNLVEEPFSSSLAYQQNSEGGQFQATLSNGNKFLLQALYDLPRGEKGTFSFQARLQDFELGLVEPTLERYAPFFRPYYGNASTITGNLSFQSTQGTGTILGFDGTFSSDLVLLDITLGNRILNAGFTILAGIEGDLVVVDSLSLSTADLRLAYNGTTDLNYWLPSGELRLFDTVKGTQLAFASFSPLPPTQYRFSITTPLVSSLLLDGVIARDGLERLTSRANLSLYGTTYPLDFSLSTPTLQIDLTSGEMLSLQAYLAPPYRAKVVADNLQLPKVGVFDHSSMDGELSLQFNTVHDWRVDATNLRLGSLLLNGLHYAFSGSLYALPSSIQTIGSAITQDATSYGLSLQYSGSDLLDLYGAKGLMPFTFSFTISENAINRLALSLIGSEERIEALSEVKKVDLGRFASSLAGVEMNLTALGHTDFKKKVSMDGKLSLEGPQFSFSTDMEATETLLTMVHGSFRKGKLAVEDVSLTLDGGNGNLSSQGRFSHIRTLSYKDQLSQFTYSLSLPFTPVDSLFDIGLAIKAMKSDRIAGTISLGDLLLYGEKGIADGTYSFSYKDKEVSINSSLLSARYDAKDGSIDAHVDNAFGIGITLGGWVREDGLYLSAKDIYFPLNLLNRLFLKPVFGFVDGVAQGEVIVGGTLSQPKIYGQLSLDSAAMDLFWLPQDILSVKNATVTIDGQRAISPTFPFFSTNRETGVTVRGMASLRADFDGFNLKSYEIHAEPTEGQVYVFIPIQGFDADIRTYAEGTFNLYGIGYETWVSGDVLLENTTMSMGITGLPSWYVPTGLSSADFTLTTGKNVTFFYPNPANPFLKATLTENQKIKVMFDHTTEAISLDGLFSFRSGEIYYFQKNFFITEGSLDLHTDAFTGSSQIQPRINLRAKLTDFDRQGNRVDIFLILRDSSLTNLNPQFESVPSKDINEILEILGQSILPTGAYGQVNLYSVASLAAAATDVAGRLGYLNTGTNTALTESIRISLGLDLFSLRSNIVQNILFDALPGSSISSSFSPLARYLNNTTIFMGKYIGKDYFLQALIHLTATDRAKILRSFVAPDLAIDLELSLEWSNPLGTFSLFTQPNELSIYNIFDTIGFSVTRRIVLR